MGKAVNKWPFHYEANIDFAGINKTTVHGCEYKWTWDVDPGTTTTKMINEIKTLIDTHYDGEPWNFTGRIVIFGCCNDLTTWPTSTDQPLKWKYAAVAEQARDCLKLLGVGRVIWLGPGTGKVWNYDQRGFIWQPWADAFMDIIAESEFPIFKGGVALAKR